MTKWQGCQRIGFACHHRNRLFEAKSPNRVDHVDRRTVEFMDVTSLVVRLEVQHLSPPSSTSLASMDINSLQRGGCITVLARNHNLHRRFDRAHVVANGGVDLGPAAVGKATTLLRLLVRRLKRSHASSPCWWPTIL
jgi:hypothetical protein